MNSNETLLRDLENDAFYLEWEYKVDNAHPYHYYREQIDRLNSRINTLRVTVYGLEHVEPTVCQGCGLRHIKETYFLNTYNNRRNKQNG